MYKIKKLKLIKFLFQLRARNPANTSNFLMFGSQDTLDDTGKYPLRRYILGSGAAGIPGVNP